MGPSDTRKVASLKKKGAGVLNQRPGPNVDSEPGCLEGTAETTNTFDLAGYFRAQKEMLSVELSIRKIPFHRPEGVVDQNILRLLGMVHELHKQGWQKIRIHSGMSSSGCYWRCAIFPAGLSRNQMGRYYKKVGPRNLVAHFTTGQDRQYFEWNDCKQDDACHLAQKFIERFPKICEMGLGRDWAYAGWFSELLGHAENGRFPYSYWDDMTSSTSRAVWLTFGEEVPFPLPPPGGLETEFWPTGTI